MGDRLKSRDELRAEWEAFRSKQKREAMEASVNYRGVYQFRADATGGWAGVGVGRGVCARVGVQGWGWGGQGYVNADLRITCMWGGGGGASASTLHPSRLAHPVGLPPALPPPPPGPPPPPPPPPPLPPPCHHWLAALVSPYDAGLPRTPELTNIYMTSGLDVPLDSRDWPALLASEQDVAHLGGAMGGGGGRVEWGGAGQGDWTLS